MTTFTDYYRILHLRPDSTAQDIKHHYRVLASKYHPDMGGDTKKMSQINEAYSILSDPQLREDYDEIYEDYYSAKEERHTQDSPDKEDEAATERANRLIGLLVTAKQEARKSAIGGFVWLAIGVAVTIVGYSVAPEGGHYVIAWGAVLFGGIQFIKGLHWYHNPHLLLRKSLGVEKYKSIFDHQEIKTSPKGIVLSLSVLIVAAIVLIVVTGSSSSGDAGVNSPSASAGSSGAPALTSDQQNLYDIAGTAKEAYSECENDLDNAKAAVDRVNSELQVYDNYNDASDYNALIPQQNRLVNAYNAKLQECDTDQTMANDAIDNYNNSIGR